MEGHETRWRVSGFPEPETSATVEATPRGATKCQRTVRKDCGSKGYVEVPGRGTGHGFQGLYGSVAWSPPPLFRGRVTRVEAHPSRPSSFIHSKEWNPTAVVAHRMEDRYNFKSLMNLDLKVLRSRQQNYRKKKPSSGHKP